MRLKLGYTFAAMLLAAAPAFAIAKPGPFIGTWVLNVSDQASLDTGSVRAFSVRLTGFTCGP